MRFYKCSKCGKEALPEGFKRIGFPSYPRFCQCETPDIEASKRRFDEEFKTMAKAIQEVVSRMQPPEYLEEFKRLKAEATT